MKNYSFSILAVRPFPTIADLNNPWIFGCIHVIINVSDHEYPKDILKAIEAKGIRWFHFPLVEEGPDMGLENILAAVLELMKADATGEKAILHCSSGNNRSKTVAEAFHFKKMGFQLEDDYRGYLNHLAYNCGEGHLPPMDKMKATLLSL